MDHPHAGEVTVKVKAIGLNFADIFSMQGLYPATPPGPLIPGLEFSGEIVAVADGVTNLKIGDRVMGATKFGGYVTHINIDHRYVIALPAEWTFEQGAGFLVQGLTAYYALTKLGDLQPNMTVLIHSAAGGVGIMANRICKKMNAYTIGTVGNKKKVSFLTEEEGYDDVIVRGDNFYHQLKSALAYRPLNLIMECIGGKTLMDGWKLMAPMGRMVVYGSASFTPHGDKPNYLSLGLKYLKRPKIDPLRLPSQNKSLMGFNLIYLYERTELMLSMLGELQDLQLRPQHVGQVFSFNDMHEAIHAFQQGGTMGKVVVVTDK